MAHCHHHPPLPSRSISGHVLCAVSPPIAIVAAVACPPPSLTSPLSMLLPSIVIALFATITIAIAIALAALVIALFDTRHPCCCRNCIYVASALFVAHHSYRCCHCSLC